MSKSQNKQTSLDSQPDYSFQSRDLARIRRTWAKGTRRVLYVLPTGAGKTNVGIAAIRKELATVRQGCALWVTHRRDLVLQARDRLVELGVDPSEIGLLASGEPVNADARFQIASSATLSSWIRLGKLPKLNVVVIVADEAHRAVSPSWLRILRAFAKANLLGLTATPFRLDGAGLGDAFDVVISGPSMTELFGLGVLAKPKVFSHDLEELLTSLRGCPTDGVDFNRKALALRVNTKTLVGHIVKHYERHGHGRPAVCFAVGVEHAKQIRDRFRKAGYKAEHVDASTPREIRDAIKQRVRSGETQIVTNCEIFTEGFDLRELRVAILARPTKSLRLYQQMVGRPMRRMGDDVPVILDHAGNAYRHDAPWFERDVSLESGVVETKGLAPVKECPACGCAVFAGAGECPECGHVFEVDREVHEDESRDLKEWETHRAAVFDRASQMFSVDVANALVSVGPS